MDATTIILIGGKQEGKGKRKENLFSAVQLCAFGSLVKANCSNLYGRAVWGAWFLTNKCLLWEWHHIVVWERPSNWIDVTETTTLSISYHFFFFFQIKTMKYIIALCLVMKCCHNVMQFLFGGVFWVCKIWSCSIIISLHLLYFKCTCSVCCGLCWYKQLNLNLHYALAGCPLLVTSGCLPDKQKQM